MSSTWRSTRIPGLFETARQEFVDDRGSFLKILGEGDSADAEPFRTQEIFWSHSRRGTFRGLHVQLPPRSTRKLVFVVAGEVRDFVLDLRIGSPTEGQVEEVRLDAHRGGLVIPDGCAHGVEVVSDRASMVYAQEHVHAQAEDSGILYSSAGIRLQSADPVISARDLALPRLEAFDSPFRFA